MLSRCYRANIAKVGASREGALTHGKGPELLWVAFRLQAGMSDYRER